MSGFPHFRNGLVGPIIILLSICLVVTGAVAATYVYTAPIIEEVDRTAAIEARQEVLPAADDFTRVDAPLPEGVDEGFRANNGAGYVFRASAKGFGGLVPFMIGMDADGNVTGIKMLDNNETPGLGSKAGEADYLSRYYGGADPGGVDGISGATLTTNALKNALALAREAYQAATR